MDVYRARSEDIKKAASIWQDKYAAFSGKCNEPHTSQQSGEYQTQKRQLSKTHSRASPPPFTTKRTATSGEAVCRGPKFKQRDYRMNTPMDGRKNAQFGKVYFQPIDAGMLARMTGSAAKVYIVLTAHAHFEDGGVCRPAIGRIAELAGIGRSTAVESIKLLEDIAAIKVCRGTGRGFSSEYVICSSVVLKGPAHRTLSTPIKGPAHRTLSEKRVQIHRLKGPDSPAKGSSPLDPNRVEQSRTEQQQASPAGNAAAVSKPKEQEKTNHKQEIFDALRAVGIGKNAWARFAAMPGISVELIYREAAKLDGTNLGIPILMANIEAACGKAVREAERHADTQDERVESAKEELKKIEHRDAAWAKADGLVKALTPEEFKRVRSEALTRMTALKQQYYADGKTDRALERDMGHRLQQQPETAAA